MVFSLKFIIRILCLFCIAGCLVASLLIARKKHSGVRPEAVQASSDNKTTAPVSIVDSGLPAGGVPALNNPRFTEPLQAARELGSKGNGIALVMQGIARFYPFQILHWHEVVNDTLGGNAVAVTYCALCNVGVVYERKAEGSELTLALSGKLHGLDALLVDSKSESLWSQVSGEALSGPFMGNKLPVLPSEIMSLEEFSARYPRGQVLSKFTGFIRNYDTLSFGDYATSMGGENVIARKGLVHPKTDIIGLEIGEEFKAYVLEKLLERGKVEDTVGGSHVVLSVDTDGTVTVESRAGEVKETLSYIQTYWFLWQLYYPTTEIYK